MPSKWPDAITGKLNAALQFVDKIHADPDLDTTTKVIKLRESYHFKRIAQCDATDEEKKRALHRLANYAKLATADLLFGFTATYQEKALAHFDQWIILPAEPEKGAQPEIPGMTG